MRHTITNPGWFATRRSAGLVALLLVAFSGGCRSTQRYEHIEAELRTRERELAETRAELEQARNLLRAYDATRQRQLPAASSSGPFLPIQEITIGRGTGGVDDDGATGDEGILVVIVPKDEDGSAIKVPASATIAAWDISPAGLKTPIGTWEIPADRLRRTWKSGLFSTGYFVAVPWQTPPANDRVRIAVRLVTPDGRAYEADRDIRVKPPMPLRDRGPDHLLPYPQPAPTAPHSPRGPNAPPGHSPNPGRPQPLLPESPPPGVPSTIPPGTEELPPPAPLDRGARLQPPIPQ
ncbi:MAG: hypothetical protein RMJ56_08780 [Gemmataceae bacterium]|nr:hypothetical protein [Gemmata sp.]MDW8197680.1 hypothetical protein [Gemmataceae bacterium]